MAQQELIKSQCLSHENMKKQAHKSISPSDLWEALNNPVVRKSIFDNQEKLQTQTLEHVKGLTISKRYSG